MRHLTGTVLIVIAALSCFPAVYADQCPHPTDTFVSYNVYYELDELPVPDDGDPLTPDVEAAPAVIEGHFVLAQEIFRNSTLMVKLVGPGKPNPQRLSKKNADMVREFLEEYVGPDSESVAEEFKSLATAAGIYDKDVLNIYYVDDTELTGIHLRQQNGFSQDVIIMGLGFEPESLAHEIGHAFSLAHVNFWSHDDPQLLDEEDKPIFPNGVQVEYCAEWDYYDNECDFSKTNLMWAGAEVRDALTTGQVDRMACNPSSALVENGDWSSDSVECPSFSKEGECLMLHQ